MCENRDTFIRCIELTSLCVKSKQACDVLLNVHQKFIGDVGCVVWDAALVLLKYLFTKNGNRFVRGKHVLELGSGTGAVGLGSVVAGAASVLITDLPEHLPLMQLNIKENENVLTKFNSKHLNEIATASVLRWGNVDDINNALCKYKNLEGVNYSLEVDCILIADCVYYKEGMLKLYETIIMLLDKVCPEAFVICCYEYRDALDKVDLLNSFISLLKSNPMFSISFVDHNDMDEEYRSDDIFIFVIHRK